jgi:propanediol dehydratase small subunit
MTVKLVNPRYPLSENNAQDLKLASERLLADLHMEPLVNGELSAQDLGIHADTLRAQAEIARQAGYDRLAANLSRAAELTSVPNDELLKMYEALCRGDRYEQSLSRYISRKYNALETGKLYTAAEVYRAWIGKASLSALPQTVPGKDGIPTYRGKASTDFDRDARLSLPSRRVVRQISSLHLVGKRC